MLQFLLPVADRAFASSGGRMLLRLPKLGGNESSVAVQQLRTAVWVPDEYALTGTPENFVPEFRYRAAHLLLGRPQSSGAADDLDGWMESESSGMIDFPTEGRVYRYRSLGGPQEMQLTWWRMPFWSWIISGALLLVALALRNTSWENKFGFLLLAALLVTLYALDDVGSAYHGLMAARYGIIGVFVLWMLHAFFGASSRQSPQRADGTPSGGAAAVAVIPPPGIFGMLAPKPKPAPPKDNPPDST
jgi:hypothetical protein